MRPTDALRLGAPAVAGALVGAALAGIYGAPAGALLAYMGGEIFRSQRLKSELAAYLTDPGGATAPVDEPEPGAALLAGIAASEARRIGVSPEAAVRVVRGIDTLPSGVSAWVARALSAVYSGKNLELSFALLAAAFDARAARSLRPAVSEMLFALLRLIREDLDSEEEMAASSRLAALGTSEEVVRESRRRFFPDYRDSWDILEIPPGSSREDIRKAWRRLSRRYHPDGASGDAQRFREAREAYERVRKSGE